MEENEPTETTVNADTILNDTSMKKEDLQDTNSQIKEEPEWLTTQIDTVYTVRSSEIETKRFELSVARAELGTTLLTKDVQLLKQLRGITTECGNLREEVGWMEQDLNDVKETTHRNILNIHIKAGRDKHILLEEINEMLETKKQLEESILQQRKYIETAKQVSTENLTYENVKLDAEINKVQKEIEHYRFGLVRGNHKFDDELNDCKYAGDMIEDEIREIEKNIALLDTQFDQQKAEVEKMDDKLKRAADHSEELKKELEEYKTRHKELLTIIEKKDQEMWENRINNLSLKFN